MIIEWIFSLSLIWLLPGVFSRFNPFFIPISTYILERKPFYALVSAYLTGILRDIFLATPRFGMLGASSLFSTLAALAICFYFSLEGFVGTLLITSLLTFCDFIFSAFLGTIFSEHAFFSLKALLLALFLSCVWAGVLKGIPFFYSLVLRRRQRDSNS